MTESTGSSSQQYEFKALGARLSNWGRWGADDQLGTVNFITPANRVAAAALIKTGETFDLGMPFDANGPQAGGLRFNPIHRMSRLLTDAASPDGMMVADDIVIMPLQCATQWDSLAHVGYDGFAYNGVPAAAITADRGATRNSFSHVAPRLLSRGVLLDIAALKGVERLDFSQEITAADLDAAEARQGVRAGSGDILLFRTGWYQQFLAGDSANYLSRRSPGLGISACEWLHDREIAAVAGDNFAVEVMPATEPGVGLPLHMVLIRDLGMTLGEMFNLEELAASCAADGVYEFMFSGIGIKITGSVGSPVTPLAIK